MPVAIVKERKKDKRKRRGQHEVGSLLPCDSDANSPHLCFPAHRRHVYISLFFLSIFLFLKPHCCTTEKRTAAV